MQSPKILVIVVTYNGEAWVDYCLSSVQNSTVPLDVVCIDNNSSDETVSLIRTGYPDILVVESKENLGFGKGNNIGLKLSMDKGYDYSFLLNQDARVEPDTIEKLVDIHKKYPEYGILSPVHRSKDDNKLDFNFSRYINDNLGNNLLSDAFLRNELKGIYETGFVNAALWLISRECLVKTGVFDPIFPHYGEDDDYIFRVKNEGLKVGIVPHAHGNHARYTVEEKEVDFSSDVNRKFVKTLIEYKYYPASRTKKVLYFSRKMILELFFHIIMLDLISFKTTLIVYGKLLHSLWSYRRTGSPLVP